MKSSRLTAVASLLVASCLIGIYVLTPFVGSAEPTISAQERNETTELSAPVVPGSDARTMPFNKIDREFQIANETLPGRTFRFTEAIPTPIGNLEKFAFATRPEITTFWDGAPANQHSFLTLSVRGHKDIWHVPVTEWRLIDSKGHEHAIAVLLHPTDGGIKDVEMVSVLQSIPKKLVFTVPQKESRFILTVEGQRVCQFQIPD